MGTAKSNSLNRHIRICHDVFTVLYLNSNKNPWGILHKYKSGNQLGSIQTFYHGVWSKK